MRSIRPLVALRIQDVATQHLEFARQTQGVACLQTPGTQKLRFCKASLTKPTVLLQIFDLQAELRSVSEVVHTNPLLANKSEAFVSEAVHTKASLL